MVVEAGKRCQAAGVQVRRGRVQMWGFRLASSNCTTTRVWICCQCHSQTLEGGRGREWEGTQVAGFSECQYSGVKNGENLPDVHRVCASHLCLFICLFCCCEVDGFIYREDHCDQIWCMAATSNSCFLPCSCPSMSQLCQSGCSKTEVVPSCGSRKTGEVGHSPHSSFHTEGNSIAGEFPLGAEQCWPDRWDNAGKNSYLSLLFLQLSSGFLCQCVAERSYPELSKNCFCLWIAI